MRRFLRIGQYLKKLMDGGIELLQTLADSVAETGGEASEVTALHMFIVWIVGGLFGMGLLELVEMCATRKTKK